MGWAQSPGDGEIRTGPVLRPTALPARNWVSDVAIALTEDHNVHVEAGFRPVGDDLVLLG
jgi:hypothetical protein